MVESLRKRAANEGGSVILLISISMVMILGFTALTVDIGRLSGERRDLQAVADVVSLDVVRELEGRIAAAKLTAPAIIGPALGAAVQADPLFEAAIQRSADRNSFPRAQLLVVVGYKAPGVFFGAVPADKQPNAVEVTAGETVDFAFAEGSASTTRRAVASRDATAGFTIGSYLASVGTTENRILNRLFGDAFGAQVVGYNGLVGAKLTLDQIGFQLGGLTPNELLTTSLTMQQLTVASAKALEKKSVENGSSSDAVAASVLHGMNLSAGGASFKLLDILKVDGGGERSAAAADFDVLSLLTGSAFLIDKDHAFTIDGANLNVPGVTKVVVDLKVIAPPQYAFGPVGVSATTAQAEMTITPTFENFTTGNLSGDKCKLKGEGLLDPVNFLICTAFSPIANVPDLVNLEVLTATPMKLSLAKATATLMSINCAPTSPNRSITLDSVGGAVSLEAGSVTFDVKPTVLGQPVSSIKVVHVQPPASIGLVGQPQSTTFTESEFGVAKAVGSSSVGLSGLLNLNTSKIQLGTVKLAKILDRFDAQLISRMNTALGLIDAQVVSRVSKTLGLSLGGADLTALSMDCNAVRLAE